MLYLELEAFKINNLAGGRTLLTNGPTSAQREVASP
jgi:hypothetical protein